MYTRKCRCVFTSLPPSCLIYCICAPSHVYFSYAFSPHVFGLPFSSRRHISRISYFSYSFAVDIFLGPAYLGWVLFDVQPGPGRHPDLFSDASTLTNRPQICCFKSEIYHQCFNIGWNILFPEIGKVRGNLFQINGYVKEPLILPEGSGPPVIHSEKVYVPVKEHPDVSIFILLSLSLLSLIFFYCKAMSSYHFIFLIMSQYLCFQEVAIYLEL